MSRRRASDAVWNTRKPLNFERYDPREPTGALTVFGGKAIIGGTFGLLCMALFSSRNLVSQRPDHSLVGWSGGVHIFDRMHSIQLNAEPKAIHRRFQRPGGAPTRRTSETFLARIQEPANSGHGRFIEREKVNITSKRPLIAPRYKSLHLFGQ